MNLAAVSLLTDRSENRPWYRVVGTRYLASAIATAHTIAVPSRFYDPITAYPQFSTLYVSDNSLVAMFEVQALFGSPTTPGGSIPAPAGNWTILIVRVQLYAVVDLSDIASQARLDLSVRPEMNPATSIAYSSFPRKRESRAERAQTVDPLFKPGAGPGPPLSRG